MAILFIAFVWLLWFGFYRDQHITHQGKLPHGYIIPSVAFTLAIPILSTAVFLTCALY